MGRLTRFIVLLISVEWLEICILYMYMSLKRKTICKSNTGTLLVLFKKIKYYLKEKLTSDFLKILGLYLWLVLNFYLIRDNY